MVFLADTTQQGGYHFDPLGPIASTIYITGGLIILFVILYFILKKVDPKGKTPLWLVPFLWVVEIINGFTKENSFKYGKT